MPIYMVSILAALALTLALLQEGSAHVLERRAETAADAAALAAADRLRGNLVVGVFGVGFGDEVAAAIAAETLAGANNADLIDLEITPASLTTRRRQVTATVETREGVVDGPVGSVTGTKVRSRSTARLTIRAERIDASSPRGASDEMLANRAGVPYPLADDSALVRYRGGRCPAVDTDRLSDDMKVALLRVEAELGDGLELDSGYLTGGCLRGRDAILPELSPAIAGDQIQLSPGQGEALSLFEDAHGFCVDGTTVVARDSPACRYGDSYFWSFITVTTRLVPNP